MKTENQVWKFFASVKLAQTVLATLAVTSIIGTIIPQQETHAFYAKRYSPFLANLFQILDIPDMYSSWWFTSLLLLLSVNLIVCSLDRFPLAWQLINADLTKTSAARIMQMPLSSSWQTNSSSQSLLAFFHSLLPKYGWNLLEHREHSQILLSAQKGAWSRLGVYLVHSAILVIFAGATVGHFFGFKGNVSIPETQQTGTIFLRGSKTTKDLGFEVRCDSFSVDFYDSGMPKEYVSKLTILENGKKIITKDIEVNSPLQYKGITFYQASYEPFRDFIITLTNQKTHVSRTFVVPYQQQEEWADEQVHFGIVNVEASGNRVLKAKLWLKAGQEQPVLSMVDTGKAIDLTIEDAQYQVKVKQMHATGLQVAKDPGVWLVYLGCFMLISGLYLAFFLTHRRIHLILADHDDGCTVHLRGTANKNRFGFEKDFAQLSNQITNLLPSKK